LASRKELGDSDAAKALTEKLIVKNKTSKEVNFIIIANLRGIRVFMSDYNNQRLTEK
jgi:hypothetical protein